MLIRIPPEEAEPHDFRFCEAEELRFVLYLLQKLSFAVVEFDCSFVPCFHCRKPRPIRLVVRIAVQRSIGLDFLDLELLHRAYLWVTSAAL